MQIPYNFTWGVDVAIKKLRPGAKFGLSNSTFVFWEDPNGLEPPTWDEITEQVKKDEQAAKQLFEKQD